LGYQNTPANKASSDKSILRNWTCKRWSLQLHPRLGDYIPEKLATVLEVISMLQAEQAQNTQRIAKLREEYLYAFGHSSKICAEHVVRLVACRSACGW